LDNIETFSVKHYDAQSNTIYLGHEYPRTSYQIIARVNLDHVLEAMGTEDFHLGAWLNITGYSCGRHLDPQYAVHFGGSKIYSEVSIRAVMVWNAALIDLPLYERALEARKTALAAS